jgi:hypothetical protein
VGLEGVTSISALPYGAAITAAAARHHIDPRLLAAVAAQETGGPGSNGGRNVVGDGGHGHGVFQIDDRSHAFARTARAMDPAANADYAAGMLAGLLARYGGNVHQALSAYNAGSPNAQGTQTTWQDGARLGYADSVLRHYAALGAPLPALLDELGAESPGERQSVNALSAFAAIQLPPLVPPPLPASHSYRQIAGLDDSGRPLQPADSASVFASDDAP